MPEEGLEPTRITPRDFESRASTNCATPAALKARGRYQTSGVWQLLSLGLKILIEGFLADNVLDHSTRIYLKIPRP